MRPVIGDGDRPVIFRTTPTATATAWLAKSGTAGMVAI